MPYEYECNLYLHPLMYLRPGLRAIYSCLIPCRGIANYSMRYMVERYRQDYPRDTGPVHVTTTTPRLQ